MVCVKFWTVIPWNESTRTEYLMELGNVVGSHVKFQMEADGIWG
jgi:hypothetical protein